MATALPGGLPTPWFAAVPGPSACWRDSGRTVACADDDKVYTLDAGGTLGVTALAPASSSSRRFRLRQAAGGSWWLHPDESTDAGNSNVNLRSAAFTPAAQPFHIFVAVRPTTHQSPRPIVNLGGGGGVCQIRQATGISGRVRVSAAGDGGIAPVDLTLGVGYLLEGVIDGANSRMAVDGGAFGTALNAGSNSAAQITLGGVNGDYGPVLVFTAEQSAQVRADLYAWFAANGYVGDPALPTSPYRIPQSVLDDLADPDGPAVVTIPPGTWKCYSPLTVARSNVELVAPAATLIHQPDQRYVVSVESTVATDPSILGSSEWHLTGTVTAGTTQLRLDPAESCPVAVGERVIVRAGVQTADPNEAYGFRWLTVLARTPGTGGLGDLLTFDREVADYDVPVYADEAAFKAAIPDASQETKVAAWGVTSPNGSPGRGLGADHGLIRFSNLVRNVTLTDITTTSDLVDGFVDGSYTARAYRVDGLTVNRLAAANPLGAGLMTSGTRGVVVNRLTLTGRGRSLTFGVTPAPAWALYSFGGSDHELYDLALAGDNLVLCNLESGCDGLTFDRFYADAAKTAADSHGGQHLGVYGGSRDTAFRNGFLRLYSGGYGLRSDTSPAYDAQNLTVAGVAPAVNFAAGNPDFLTPPGFWDGSLPPGAWETTTYTVTNPVNRVVLPTRLYKSVRVRSASGPAIASVTPLRGNPWASEGGGWFRNTSNNITTTEPTFSSWLDQLKLAFTVASGSLSDATLEFEVTWGPLPDSFTSGGVGARLARDWARVARRAGWSLARLTARPPRDWARLARFKGRTMTPHTFTKSVSDDRDFGFDLRGAPEVWDGSAVVSAAATGAISGGSGLSFGSPAVLSAAFDGVPVGAGMKCRIYGGTAGTTYTFALVVTLASGRVLTVPCRMVVVADVPTS